jgi:hypothetical protein
MLVNYYLYLFFGFSVNVKSSGIGNIYNSTAIGANSIITTSNQIVLGTSAETIIIPIKNSTGVIIFPNATVTSGTKTIKGYIPIKVGTTTYYLALYQ